MKLISSFLSLLIGYAFAQGNGGGSGGGGSGGGGSGSGGGGASVLINNCTETCDLSDCQANTDCNLLWEELDGMTYRSETGFSDDFSDLCNTTEFTCDGNDEIDELFDCLLESTCWDEEMYSANCTFYATYEVSFTVYSADGSVSETDICNANWESYVNNIVDWDDASISVSSESCDSSGGDSGGDDNGGSDSGGEDSGGEDSGGESSGGDSGGESGSGSGSGGSEGGASTDVRRRRNLLQEGGSSEGGDSGGESGGSDSEGGDSGGESGGDDNGGDNGEGSGGDSGGSGGGPDATCAEVTFLVQIAYTADYTGTDGDLANYYDDMSGLLLDQASGLDGIDIYVRCYENECCDNVNDGDSQCTAYISDNDGECTDIVEGTDYTCTASNDDDVDNSDNSFMIQATTLLSSMTVIFALFAN